MITQSFAEKPSLILPQAPRPFIRPVRTSVWPGGDYPVSESFMLYHSRVFNIFVGLYCAAEGSYVSMAQGDALLASAIAI